MNDILFFQSLWAKASGLTAEGEWFPKAIDELKPVLENATEFNVHHLDVQPNARPRKLED